MSLATFHYDVIIDAASMAATINSSPIKLKNFKGFSVQLVSTGSPVGTYKIQCSNDPDILNIANWSDVGNSSQIIDGSGIIFYNIVDAFYMFARIVYTRTSGTGTLTARVNLKD